jgi:TM2 domain-containing membrane protein YozV
MSEILVIGDSTVKIGDDNGTVTELPLASLHFSNPAVGDKVRIYKDGDAFIVKREETLANSIVANDGDRRKVNKIVYILLAFFLGGIGVHRFMRGQVGLGILMIITAGGFGVWTLIDFIISLVKLSSYPGDDYIFTADGRFTQ